MIANDEVNNNVEVEIIKNKVGKYFIEYPDSWEFFEKILVGERSHKFDGEELVNNHMKPLIKFVFDAIDEEVSPNSLTASSLLDYIKELSVFARYNPQILKNAAAHTRDAVPELSAELTRNFLEEGGNAEISAHYVLYSSALLKDVEVNVVGHPPSACTINLCNLIELLSRSHSASIICGALFSTEGVAIRETELLQKISTSYAKQMGKEDLCNLQYYYDLHLDYGVEQGHIDGIGRFISQYESYHLKLPQICDGFLQGITAMSHWWTSLSLAQKKTNDLNFLIN